MKELLISVFFSVAIPFVPEQPPVLTPNPLPTTGNLFIITTDGFRWQEVFTGADPALLADETATPDTATMSLLFNAPSAEERRKKLLPFFWNILAQKGQVYGNREYDNKVNVANIYSISYPGYNEIFTGNTDLWIGGNKKKRNPNINVLEYLEGKAAFKGKVAAFTSWDVFPYILNGDRNGVYINSGYDTINDPKITATQQVVNRVQEDAVADHAPTRYDMLTFITAKEHLQQYRPKLFFLGLGETDEFAHRGRYDLYLQQANNVDRMIAELWHWVQTTPGYKDNTTFIITTDHGRGKKASTWSGHNAWIKGSSEVWMAVIGPGIKAMGEVKTDQQLYQKQLAQTIAHLLGEEFEADAPIARRMEIKN